MQATIIPLGAGKSHGTGIGAKARLLDKAARSGIAVPDGLIIRTETLLEALLRRFLDEDLAEVVTCPDAAKFANWLDLPTFGSLVAVRSAFTEEDKPHRSYAGTFDSVLHINANDPADLVAALCRVWTSATRVAGDFRRDVLILEMVNAQTAGVAFTEREYADDIVNYTAGLADKLAAGLESGASLQIPQLWAIETHPHPDLPPWAQRLQGLLRQVRMVFGAQDWDIEWADDGTTCYLLQIRPITRSIRRNETFTIANHKEVLPDLPSMFMTDLVASCADELFEYYRGFDRTLPAQRPFIEVFAGRPFINLSLMTELMRQLGLPTRLVTDSIGGEADQESGFHLRRIAYKTLTLVLPRMALAQLRSVQSVKRASAQVDQRNQAVGASLSEILETARWMYITLVHEMFTLTMAIAPLTMLLRNMGTLEEHNARQRTISTQVYEDQRPLREYISQHPHLSAALRAGEMPDDEHFRQLWSAWLARYGHRGIYESDLSRPRYHEQPERLLPTLVQPHHTRTIPPRTPRGWLTLPLWWQAGRVIRARENWRHHLMHGFDAVRVALLRHADDLVQQGALPDRDALWMLKLAEMRKLETGWIPGADFFAARQAEIEALKRYHLPDLLHRFDDLERYQDGFLQHESGDRLQGISLTDGTLEGQAWVLQEPEMRLPDGFVPENTILIARSVDAGWIPSFALVKGVVVETGGDLSHGSIILREMGLPAITNVRDVTHALQTGDRIRLRAGVGLVEVLREA